MVANYGAGTAKMWIVEGVGLSGLLLLEAYNKRYSSKIPSDLVLFLGLGFIDCGT
ncbi:hypothetical protein M569_10976 [Genlisea aurea]|uniref:Uncharacterized protein n=1 Tax=Genlisea aurea TaxID=192259 RepID=S8CA63_9LAMI|nr:hypothetical protein M569_10976 [Genlisea aurea]